METFHSVDRLHDDSPLFLTESAGSEGDGNHSFSFSNLSRALNSLILENLRSSDPVFQEKLQIWYLRYNRSSVDLIRRFPPPLWIWLGSLIRESGEFNEQNRPFAEIHVLTLFLHSLDDHIIDGQIQRSTEAMWIRNSLRQRIQELIDLLMRRNPTTGFTTCPHRLLHTYEEALAGKFPAYDLKSYLNRFRKEMSIWKISPCLLETEISGRQERDSPLVAFLEEFSVAYRMVDDLEDTLKDSREGVRSSVYYELGPETREIWERGAKSGGDPVWIKAFEDSLRTDPGTGRILKRIETTLKESIHRSQEGGWSFLKDQVVSWAEEVLKQFGYGGSPVGIGRAYLEENNK